VILAVLTGSVTVHACYEPANVFGIQFNAGESVDPDIIATMGEEGVNYRVNTMNVYTFRGHYDPSVMVSLASTGMSFVIDTSVIQLEGFPFGTCIRTELDWLVDAGILAMDRLAIERAEQAYNDRNPSWFSTAGPVYWTNQDTLLVSSIWIDENGTYVLIDCIGSDGTVDLPPQSLVTSSVRSIRYLRRNMEMSATTSSNGTNRIFDISGRLIHQKSYGLQAGYSGVVLIHCRKSEAAKRVVILP
jgi:hypothetical protein